MAAAVLSGRVDTLGRVGFWFTKISCRQRLGVAAIGIYEKIAPRDKLELCTEVHWLLRARASKRGRPTDRTPPRSTGHTAARRAPGRHGGGKQKLERSWIILFRSA
jgi:hypothetical protein